MTWTCAAIDHGVTIYNNGKIGPCCQISENYLKPISELTNPNRFADLKTQTPPRACQICVQDEADGIGSYRKFFNSEKINRPGLQFVDIRNTNLCNIKCRYCGPHFSNKWGEELGQTPSIKNTPIEQYRDLLITDSLHWMYFTGGEPMISSDHWDLLEYVIDLGIASRISIMYNSNLTTVKYKDKDIADIWRQFKQVRVNCSVDAVGEPLNYIRSGSDWNRISGNINHIRNLAPNVQIYLTPVISILNIWFLKDLLQWSVEQNIPVEPIILTGPDYLALDVMPDQCQEHALEILTEIENVQVLTANMISKIKNMISKNQNQYLFQHTINHILLLDHMRKERLYDLLPFKSVAIEKILHLHAYE
jgi:sulfatase maturation enzyme AslB (radical SAM superfamily)